MQHSPAVRLAHVIAAVLLVFASAAAAATKPRVALVIGNGEYLSGAALRTAVPDARAVAAALTRLGFDVNAGMNLDRRGMDSRVRAFGEAARNAEIAVVFYAGYAVELSGENYLLPVSARLARAADVKTEAVRVDDVVAKSAGAKVLRLLLFDASWENSFSERLGAGEDAKVGRGLGPIAARDAKLVIASAAGEHEAVREGEGAQSAFVAALLKRLEAPGVSVPAFLGEVREEVTQASGGKQQPIIYSGPAPPAVALKPPAPPSPEDEAKRRLQIAAAPALFAPRPAHGKTIAVLGFRSAHFGMSEEQVRAVIPRDLALGPAAIAASEIPLWQTRTLKASVRDLLPGSGTAAVYYIFGYKTGNLAQVNVEWSKAVDPEMTPQRLLALAKVLVAYLKDAGYRAENVRTNVVVPNGYMLFRGADAEGHSTAVVMAGSYSKNAGGQQLFTPSSLAIQYALDSKNPDIFRIEPGQF